MCSFASASSTAAASTAASTVLTTVTLTPDVTFTTVPALLAFIEAHLANASIDGVTVGGVTPAQCARIDHEFTVVAGHKWRQFYFAAEQLLILTIPNEPHEQLHLRLHGILVLDVSRMGLDDAWDLTGSTRYAPAGSASYGEGDSSGKPSLGRPRKSAWPTIAFEAGFSESLDSLRAKLSFWFAASGHDVKIVVLAKAFSGALKDSLSLCRPVVEVELRCMKTHLEPQSLPSACCLLPNS